MIASRGVLGRRPSFERWKSVRAVLSYCDFAYDHAPKVMTTLRTFAREHVMDLKEASVVARARTLRPSHLPHVSGRHMSYQVVGRAARSHQ